MAAVLCVKTARGGFIVTVCLPCHIGSKLKIKSISEYNKSAGKISTHNTHHVNQSTIFPVQKNSAKIVQI
jgi:hypothetical protein